MKKLTGVLAIFFMAGMLFFGIGERVDGEGTGLQSGTGR